MEWIDSDSFPEDSKSPLSLQYDFLSSASTNIDENERKNAIQLKKFSDPSKDPNRRSLLEVADNFSRLLEINRREEIDKTLLSEDCLVFALNFDNRIPIRYSAKLGEGLATVYPDVKIVERNVLEKFVDVQKSTVIQICKCLIWSKEENNGEGSMTERVTYDVFSIRDHKIFKYRVFFGTMTDAHTIDPFILTTEEKMLARVKEINYALCGTPDLERFASLLDEETEFKICSWEEQKCIVFDKYDLVEKFRELQEKLEIVRVIPYDFSVNGCRVQANYVYYLQDKGREDGQKYVWISNCVYLFDDQNKIAKILQMGELCIEGETAIPFEASSREDFLDNLKSLVKNDMPNFDVFYEGKVKFRCLYCEFMETKIVNRPCVGTLKADKFIPLFTPETLDHIQWIKSIDTFVDQQDPSYETELTLSCELAHYKVGEKTYIVNGISFGKSGFENDKLSKLIRFCINIDEPIPSFYDDLEFSAEYIISAKDFYYC